MTKKTQLWLGILVGGAVAYYLYDHHKKTGKWFNATGRKKMEQQGWYFNDTNGVQYYCPSNERPCPVDLKRIDR